MTSYFYENCLDFKIINFTSGIKLINKSQAIDKKRDLIRFKNFYKSYKIYQNGVKLIKNTKKQLVCGVVGLGVDNVFRNIVFK